MWSPIHRTRHDSNPKLRHAHANSANDLRHMASKQRCNRAAYCCGGYLLIEMQSSTVEILFSDLIHNTGLLVACVILSDRVSRYTVGYKPMRCQLSQ